MVRGSPSGGLDLTLTLHVSNPNPNSSLENLVLIPSMALFGTVTAIIRIRLRLQSKQSIKFRLILALVLT